MKLLSINPAFVIRFLSLAIGYTILARLVLTFATANGNATIFWIPGGFALATLLIWGWKYWPAIFIGALSAGLLVEDPPGVSLLLALGNTLETLSAFWILNKVKGFNLDLNKTSNFLQLATAGVLASVISAVIGPLALFSAGFIPSSALFKHFLNWWQADILGIVLGTPIFLIWRQAPRGWLKKEQILETFILFFACFLTGQAIFSNWFNTYLGHIALGYWMFPFAVWIGVRRGRHGVLLVLCMTAIQALFGAVNEIGFFAHDLKNTGLQNFWFYLLSLTVVGLALAIHVENRRRIEEELREKEAFFRIITENSEDFIAVLDLSGRRLYNNHAYSKLFGDVESLKGTDSFAEIHPEDKERIRQIFKDTIKYGHGQRAEFRFLLPSGVIRTIESCGGLIRNDKGEPVSVVVVSHDITDRKRIEQEIHNLAFYDQLTQLPNRRLLNDRLTQAMAASKRSGAYCAMLFLDLDNFKPLNDRHGHSVGDMLLEIVAERLKNSVREIDTVARFGGDEFVVVLCELATDIEEAKAHANSIAEKIRNALSVPYRMKAKYPGKEETVIEHTCTVSIGMTLFLGHDESEENILNKADAAMYQAKEAGRNLIKVTL